MSHPPSTKPISSTGAASRLCLKNSLLQNRLPVKNVIAAAAAEIKNRENQRTKLLLLLLLLARIELGDESASLHLKQTNRKNVQSAKSSKKESKQRNKECGCGSVYPKKIITCTSALLHCTGRRQRQ
jgi:hypothetical protein